MLQVGPSGQPAEESGAVTAELAVVLPAVVALVAVVLAAAALGMTQLRFEEAARAGAREIMRGEPAAVVDATVRRIAGGEARLTVQDTGAFRTVLVSGSVDAPVLDLFNLELSARAVANPELGG